MHAALYNADLFLTLLAIQTKRDTFAPHCVYPDCVYHNEPFNLDLHCLPFCSWFLTVIPICNNGCVRILYLKVSTLETQSERVYIRPKTILRYMNIWSICGVRNCWNIIILSAPWEICLRGICKISSCVIGLLHWYWWILSRVGISKDASLRASVVIPSRDNIHQYQCNNPFII